MLVKASSCWLQSTVYSQRKGTEFISMRYNNSVHLLCDCCPIYRKKWNYNLRLKTRGTIWMSNYLVGFSFAKKCINRFHFKVASCWMKYGKREESFQMYGNFHCKWINRRRDSIWYQTLYRTVRPSFIKKHTNSIRLNETSRHICPSVVTRSLMSVPIKLATCIAYYVPCTVPIQIHYYYYFWSFFFLYLCATLLDIKREFCTDFEYRKLFSHSHWKGNSTVQKIQ